MQKEGAGCGSLLLGLGLFLFILAILAAGGPMLLLGALALAIAGGPITGVVVLIAVAGLLWLGSLDPN